MERHHALERCAIAREFEAESAAHAETDFRELVGIDLRQRGEFVERSAPAPARLDRIAHQLGRAFDRFRDGRVFLAIAVRIAGERDVSQLREALGA